MLISCTVGRRLATPKSVIKKPVSATPKIIKKSVTLPKSIQKSSRHKGTCTCIYDL